MGHSFQPGDLARGFANLYGWPIKARTLLVEGEHDQRYFGLADQLYAEKTGLCLPNWHRRRRRRIRPSAKLPSSPRSYGP